MMTLALAVLGAAPIPIGLDEVRSLSRGQNAAAVLAELTQANSAEQVRLARSAIAPQIWLSGSATDQVNGPAQNLNLVPQFDSQNSNKVTSFTPAVVSTPTYSQAQLGLALNVSQLIYDGGKWWNAIRQAGAQELAAERQLDEQRNTSEFEGVRRFYELYRAQQSLEVLEATVRRSQEQLERANALYEAGRAPKVDVFAAEVNLGNDRIAVLRQRAAFSSAEADLAIWIGRPGDESFLAQPPVAAVGLPKPPPAMESALASARDHRPLLRALNEQVRAADFGVQVARSGFWPKLSLTGSVGRAGTSLDPVFTNPSLENQATAGVLLRWDIFNGWATDAQTNQARVAQAQAEVNLAEATREVDGDVHRTVDALAMNVDAVAVAAANRHSAASAVQFAEERFKAGAGSTLEVRDAQQKLTQAELSLLSTRIDVEIARANVTRVVGLAEARSQP